LCVSPTCFFIVSSFDLMSSPTYTAQPHGMGSLQTITIMQQPGSSQAKRILVVQTVLTLALTAVAVIFGVIHAISVMIGAGVCTMANALLAFWVFKPYRAQEAGLLVMRFYAAEIIKIIFILVMFGIAIALIDGLNFPALLGAYFVAQVIPVLFASSTGAAKKT